MDFDFSVLNLPYEPGQWRDADDRMFHACFAILGQYVEDELGTKPWDFLGGDNAMHRGYRQHATEGDDKAIDLWLWYRDELPALTKEVEDDLMDCYEGGDCQFLEQIDENGQKYLTSNRVRESKFAYDHVGTVCDKKLRELIDIRRTLWT